MEDFVPFELAVKLKEKGFNLGIYRYYENKELKWSNSPWLEPKYNDFRHNIISAPTISQALKWLRKEKDIYITIFIDDDSDIPVTYEIYNNTECVCTHQGEYFTLNDWNKCELRAIEYAIDNLI